MTTRLSYYRSIDNTFWRPVTQVGRSANSLLCAGKRRYFPLSTTIRHIKVFVESCIIAPRVATRARRFAWERTAPEYLSPSVSSSSSESHPDAIRVCGELQNQRPSLEVFSWKLEVSATFLSSRLESRRSQPSFQQPLT